MISIAQALILITLVPMHNHQTENDLEWKEKSYFVLYESSIIQVQWSVYSFVFGK